MAASIPRVALATLGGDASSIDADRVRSQGALLGIAAADSYTVHQFQTSSSITVREYISSSGTVFAVAWEGPWLPDLRQLLGARYTRFEAAAQQLRQTRRRRGP